MTHQSQMLEPPFARWRDWTEDNKYRGSRPRTVSPEIPTCSFVISLHVTSQGRTNDSYFTEMYTLTTFQEHAVDICAFHSLSSLLMVVQHESKIADWFESGDRKTWSPSD